MTVPEKPRALLEVENLKKHFTVSAGLGRPRVAKAVDGVSFEVPAGQTLGLIGESGCGKSTTAKMLLRLEDPTSGRILFDGMPVQNSRGAELRAYRRCVQAVFQDPMSSLNPRMRVNEIIAEPLIAARAMARHEIDERVRTLLDVVGLSRTAADLYPHEFSGGQRQRIAIARGIAPNPRLLILDEPVSALDVSVRAQILNLLQDLQAEFSLSYLLISHDLDIVSHMCAAVAVMYLGRIVERGRMADVRAAPQHPYTQALFSSVLPNHPDRRHERIRLRGPLSSPLDLPDGCNFSLRCPIAQPRCGMIDPAMVATAAGSEAACHFVEPAL